MIKLATRVWFACDVRRSITFFRSFPLDSIISTHLARLRQQTWQVMAKNRFTQFALMIAFDRFFFSFPFFRLRAQEIKIRYLNNLDFTFETNEVKCGPKKNIIIHFDSRAGDERWTTLLFNFGIEMSKLRRDTQVEKDFVHKQRRAREKVRRKTSTADTPTKKKCNIIIHFV